MDYEKQRIKIENQERKIIHKKNTIIKAKTAPGIEKLTDKIPEKLQKTLESAFYSAFKTVFNKGSGIIEKTYNKEELIEEYEINHFAVGRHPSKKWFKNMDKSSGKNLSVNAAATTAIGTGLGILGIGLPDIPVFLGLLLRQLYQTALSYGFEYETEAEQVYLLYLIRTAVAPLEEREPLHQECTNMAEQLNQNIITHYDMEEELKETSSMLAKSMLTAKFIQGIPVVGVVGGISNNVMLNKICKYARLQYKKRYLLLIEP